MVNAKPLPAQLAKLPFTIYQARDLEVASKRLRAKDLRSGGRLIRQHAGMEPVLAERARILAAATPNAWVSHRTAAHLNGLDVPSWMDKEPLIHLSKPHGLPRVRRTGVIGHRVHVIPGEVTEIDGIPVTTPARTWLDLAHELPLRFVIAQGDQLIRVPRPGLEFRTIPYASKEELRLMIRQHPNMKGVEKARLALDEMRVGSDSFPETFLRMALLDAHLPEPELQLQLAPHNPFSPAADLGYRRHRIAVQYDGAHHRSREQQTRDNRRDEAFINAGWFYFKPNADDLADGFLQLVARIKHARRSR